MRSIDMPNAAEVQTMMECSGFDHVLKYNIDARLMLPEILSSKSSSPANIICYMTNTPFDEFESPIFLSSTEKMSKINQIRDGFKSKQNENFRNINITLEQ